MRRAHKRQHRKKRKPTASRLRTELRKRQADQLRRAGRKQLKWRRLVEPLGSTARRRVKAVCYYAHWRQRQSEREAAQRAGS